MNSPLAASLIEPSDRSPEAVSGAPSPTKRSPQAPVVAASAVSRPDRSRSVPSPSSTDASTGDAVREKAGFWASTLSKWRAPAGGAAGGRGGGAPGVGGGGGGGPPGGAALGRAGDQDAG